jgi:predicted dehydrogenase
MNTYRVGIVGCSGISVGRSPASPLFGTTPGSHAAACAEIPGCQVVAVCDLVPERMEAAVERWRDVWSDLRTYADHRELLRQEGIDLLCVATSDHAHADIVVDGAEAGVKGIFCEKPLATSVADADRMIAAVEANRVVMSVDHTRRWRPIFHQARDLVRQGALGPLARITATLGGPRAMMFRNGTHTLDMVCFFAEAAPAWVVAELEDGYDGYAEYQGDGGHDPRTDPAVSAYIRFTNGARAHFDANKQAPAGSDWELVGPQGQILVNDTRLELWTLREGHLDGRLLPPAAYPQTGVRAGLEELLRVLEHGGQTTCDGREALKTVELLLGMLRSHTEGNVRVDLPLPR